MGCLESAVAGVAGQAFPDEVHERLRCDQRHQPLHVVDERLQASKKRTILQKHVASADFIGLNSAQF